MTTARSRPGSAHRAGAARRAFTLVELLVTIAIIVIMLGVVTLAFQRITDSNALASAVGTLATYAGVARAYAIENGIETMLVVNPVNGRLELWHANPPSGGGPWDPQSTAFPNGYAYAPVLDSTASLPTGPDHRSLVVVHPIDATEEVAPGTPLRATTEGQQSRDNLNWVAICFSAEGRLVQQVRRIATRLPTDYSGAAVANPNRREDGTPDLARTLPTAYQVDAGDSLILSTRGVVVSDRKTFEQVFALFNGQPPPQQLVDLWLDETPNTTTPGIEFREFKRRVFFGLWSAREVPAVE
ncbi:MAG: prepilin-type N-terminal cleavage/methylation domain-containing protein [Phycisphaerae bacterium]|nr:prepilin-type N-terminal cleavage/methylation domain-containing protein [Phycisphaerae bacterium]